MASDNRLGGIAYWAHLGGFFAGVILLRIVVSVLRRQEASVEAVEEKTSASSDRNAAAGPVTSSDSDPEHDPYAGFVTMQTIRRMQEKNNGEHGR